MDEVSTKFSCKEVRKSLVCYRGKSVQYLDGTCGLASCLWLSDFGVELSVPPSAC